MTDAEFNAKLDAILDRLGDLAACISELMARIDRLAEFETGQASAIRLQLQRLQDDVGVLADHRKAA
jgi:hypothetical protein